MHPYRVSLCAAPVWLVSFLENVISPFSCDVLCCYYIDKGGANNEIRRHRKVHAVLAQPTAQKSSNLRGLASDSQTKFSPKEIAKAWKEYDNGTYKDGCANAMAIALGEGLPPALASPLFFGGVL